MEFIRSPRRLPCCLSHYCPHSHQEAFFTFSIVSYIICFARFDFLVFSVALCYSIRHSFARLLLPTHTLWCIRCAMRSSTFGVFHGVRQRVACVGCGGGVRFVPHLISHNSSSRTCARALFLTFRYGARRPSRAVRFGYTSTTSRSHLHHLTNACHTLPRPMVTESIPRLFSSPSPTPCIARAVSCLLNRRSSARLLYVRF